MGNKSDLVVSRPGRTGVSGAWVKVAMLTGCGRKDGSVATSRLAFCGQAVFVLSLPQLSVSLYLRSTRPLPMAALNR